MTQALNLALFANFVDSSGQVSASGIQAGAIPASFPSGTLMLFQQTSAPTGWTKQTTHDNKALRVVSGTASSGGSVVFTTAFGTPAVNATIGATTLTTAQIPSHTHTYIQSNDNNGGATAGNQYGSPFSYNSGVFSANSGAQGSGGSHTHSVSGSTATINVLYVDLIIASKT